MALTPEALSDFDEQIAAFYQRAPSRAEAEKELAAHCSDLLGQLPQMAEILNDYPAYAAMAFHGKLQIVDRPLIVRLSHACTPAQTAIDAIRAHKALRVAASAKSGWDFLLEHNLPALWRAIQLHALAKPADGGRGSEDEDDDEDDEDDPCEDEDAWNDEDEEDED
ncbi:MAG TPA: hypothetical protein VNQ90_03010 [Chthoniobacteraceae bacterium]|nr:hypothetical protein [Chthoniobacteraceae bacterium]